MTTAYTSLLGLALPVTGELSGTWGDTVNNSITSLLDSAVSGTTTLSTDADVTLTTTSGAANEARQAIILWNPASGTVTRNITAPAQSKIYTVINASGGTQSIVIRGAGPTTGVTIIKGEAAQVAWNGSDFVKISSSAGDVTVRNLAVTGTLAVTGATTLTGAFTANGNSTLGDAVGDTVTVNGTATFVNANPTLSAGTANGVTYLNGSKVLTSGSALTFDGTNLTSPSVRVGANLGLSSLFEVYSTSYGNLAAFRSVPGDGINPYLLITSSASGITFEENGSSYGSFMWKTNGSEQMRLTSTGLGIGTSSPTQLLQVGGSVRGQVRVVGTNGSSPTIGLDHTATTDGRNYVLYSGFPNAGAFSIYDATAGAARLVIDSSGNLGLGVTPSAWGSNYSAMQFRTKAGIANYSGTDSIELLSNAFANTDNAFKYIETYAAARYVVGAGAHAWFTAPSGTAGNAISFTQAMTLDASGNLGVGTTSPSARLDVYQATQSNSTFRAYGPAGQILWANGGSSTSYLDSDTTIFRQSSASGNAERMRLDSSGNLGIGVTSPLARVEAFGSLRASSTTNTAFRGIEFGYTGTAQVYGSVAMELDGGQLKIEAGYSGYGGYQTFHTNGAERMRLDIYGNLGIGLVPTSGYGALQVLASGTTITGGVQRAIEIYDASSGSGEGGALTFSSATCPAFAAMWGYSSNPGGSLIFGTNAANTGYATERMRIDSSGNLLVGQTSSGVINTNGIWITGSAGGQAINHINGTGSGAVYMYYGYNGATIGSITQSGTTGVLYNITSDYRLKDIDGPVTNSGAFIDSLNPVQGSWKADGSRFIGFLAHELQEASETVVGTGEKDGEEMQSIDYSNAELIANLVAELQSLRARVAQLEAA